MKKLCIIICLFFNIIFCSFAYAVDNRIILLSESVQTQPKENPIIIKLVCIGGYKVVLLIPVWHQSTPIYNQLLNDKYRPAKCNE